LLYVFQLRVNAQVIDTLKEHVHSANREIISLAQENIFAIHHDSTLHYYSTLGIARLLSVENGIYIKSYGQGGISTLSKRGASGSQTQVLWNDLPINSATLGVQDLSLIPLSLSNEIVVQNNAIQNSGIEGGINLKTVQSNQTNCFLYTKEIGSFEALTTIIKGEYGKGNWRGTSALLQQSAVNNFEYEAYDLPERPILKREHAAFSSKGASQSAFFNKKNFTAFAHMQWVSMHREVPSAIGVLSSKPLQDDQSFKAVSGVEHVGIKSRQKLQFGMIQDELTYTDNTIALFSAVQTTQWSAQYFIRDVLISSNWRFNGFVQGLSITANSNGFSERKQQARGMCYTAFHYIKNSHNLIINLRQELIDNQFSTLLPGLTYTKFIGEKPAVKLVGAIQTNYRYPTLNDLYWLPGGNPNLLPEKAVLGEFGGEMNVFKTNTRIQCFYSLTDNWIQWLPTTLGYWTPQNIKVVERKGLEINSLKSIRLTSSQELTVKANYTFVLATNRKTDVLYGDLLGKQLMYVPKHTVGIFTAYYYKKFEIVYTQSVYSKTFIDVSNQYYLPYVAPADLQMGAALTDNSIRAYFAIRVQNVFNESYQIIANQPMPGRFYSVVFRLTLQQ
jgi:vitamin B12 transporter